MSAAKDLFVGLHTVAYDLDPTMETVGRKLLNGTFKTVEPMGGVVFSKFDLKRLFVFIAADFTFLHQLLLHPKFSMDPKFDPKSGGCNLMTSSLWCGAN